MKGKALKWFDIAIESMVYITASYALTSMAMNFFTTSWFWFLFSLAEVFLTTNYWNKMKEKTENTILTTVLFAVCFSVYVVMLYFIGYISGTLTPMKWY